MRASGGRTQAVVRGSFDSAAPDSIRRIARCGNRSLETPVRPVASCESIRDLPRRVYCAGALPELVTMRD
jgi:hypothetical protein